MRSLCLSRSALQPAVNQLNLILKIYLESYHEKMKEGHKFKFNLGGIKGEATMKGIKYKKAGQIPV